MEDFIKRLLGTHPDQQEIDEKKEEILRLLRNTRKQNPTGPHVIAVPDRCDPGTLYVFNRYESYAEALNAARDLFGADLTGKITIIKKAKE